MITHENFRQRMNLVRAYFEDGALHTAAERLRELAADIQKDADKKYEGEKK